MTSCCIGYASRLLPEALPTNHRQPLTSPIGSRTPPPPAIPRFLPRSSSSPYPNRRHVAGPHKPVPFSTSLPLATSAYLLSYISYRQSYSHHPSKRPRFLHESSDASDRRGLLSSSPRPSFSDHEDTIIEMDLLPPRWADVSDEVNEMLHTISRKSAQLDRLHAKHVLPGFDDNRAQEEGEIEKLTTDITGMFHRCQERIGRIPGMVQGEGRGEEVMARNIQVALATKVQEESTRFRKKQSAYLKSPCPSSSPFSSWAVR